MIIINKEKGVAILDIRRTLDLLNLYLQKTGERRTFIICGGASIILRGIQGRGTSDIDIIAPEIDQTLKESSLRVAKDLDLEADWLNDKPRKFYAKDLPTGWKAERSTSILRAISPFSRFQILILRF